jgi:hypothetical protein
MREHDEEILKQLARRYIWWKSPERALRSPQRIIAQVMNLGDYEDVQLLANQLGDEALRKALKNAEAGQFNGRSWAYWHYRLGLSELRDVPPMPVRVLP